MKRRNRILSVRKGNKMTKKAYCPMTVEYEALMMNQAIAGGCTYMTNGGTKNCEDCDDCGLVPKGSHTFQIYSNPFRPNNPIGISVQNAPYKEYIGGSNCYDFGVTSGMVIEQTDSARLGYFDPCPDNQNPVVLFQISAPADSGGGFWYDSNGNIVYNSNS